MRYSVCKRLPYEKPVQNGLSLTPSQIADMVSRGVPVSTSNLVGTFDTLPDGSVPREYHRGVSLNDLWNERLDARRKSKQLEFQPLNNE